METKILFLMLLLLFINAVSQNDHQEVLSSNDLAIDGHEFAAIDGHEYQFSFNAMPRKLMLNPKVESFKDKDLGSYNEDLPGELSHKGVGEEAPAMSASSKVSMQEESYPARVFTLDYSRVKKRRPVHNKSLPATVTSP